MKKKKLRFLACTMVLLLSFGLLTGCSDDTDEEDTYASSSTSSTEVEASSTTEEKEDVTVDVEEAEEEAEEVAESGNVFGAITELAADYVNLDVYTTTVTEITEWTTFDTTTLIADTTAVESVVITEETEYYAVSEGALVAITYENLVVGDIVVATQDETGKQQLIVLVEATETEEGIEEVATGDIVGTITEVGETYLYLSSLETDGNKVEDWTTFDITTLTEGADMEYIYFEETIEYYTVSEGSLVAASYEDLAAGDIVVATRSDEDVQQIIVLTAAEKEGE